MLTYTFTKNQTITSFTLPNAEKLQSKPTYIPKREKCTQRQQKAPPESKDSLAMKLARRVRRPHRVWGIAGKWKVELKHFTADTKQPSQEERQHPKGESHT